MAFKVLKKERLLQGMKKRAGINELGKQFEVSGIEYTFYRFYKFWFRWVKTIKESQWNNQSNRF